MVGNVCLSETRRQEVVGEPGVISVCMCGCRGGWASGHVCMVDL